MRTPTLRRALAAAATLTAGLMLTGCGSSVDPALLKSAGEHGNVLEADYALQAKEILKNASTRDLKDVNAAIKAGDPKKATAGDLRRAQGEVQDRIDAIDRYRRSMVRTNRKLKTMELPDFDELGNSAEVTKFNSAYEKATSVTTRTGTVVLTATSLATAALERYLDFLEQWEEYVTKNDTAGFESAAKASDAALAKLKRREAQLKRQGNLSEELSPLVDDMADAASEDSSIADLITELREDYPKSFLPVHIVEK
jgi:hypothetical protein